MAYHQRTTSKHIPHHDSGTADETISEDSTRNANGGCCGVMCSADNEMKPGETDDSPTHKLLRDSNTHSCPKLVRDKLFAAVSCSNSRQCGVISCPIKTRTRMKLLQLSSKWSLCGSDRFAAAGKKIWCHEDFSRRFDGTRTVQQVQQRGVYVTVKTSASHVYGSNRHTRAFSQRRELHRNARLAREQGHHLLESRPNPTDVYVMPEKEAGKAADKTL